MRSGPECTHGVSPAASPCPSTTEEIRDHIDIAAKQEVLIDGLCSYCLSLRRGGRAPFDLVTGEASRDRLERAGAIVAERANDLATTDLEADAAQCFDGAELPGTPI
jgi:hypothetical protein